VIKCKHCDAEKPEDQMAIRAGKPSKVCLECKEKRVGLASAGGGRSKANGRATSKKKTAAARRAKRVATELELTLPSAGYGCVARVTDEGFLQLTQENDGTEADNICLMKHEAKAIFDRFGEWIVSTD
jgi:hypothetical protein